MSVHVCWRSFLMEVQNTYLHIMFSVILGLVPTSF